LGDFSPIGRFFAYWAIFRLLGDFSPTGRLFTLGSFFENDRSSPYFCATFFHGNKLRINFDKIMGYTLGVFSQPHLVTLMPKTLKLTVFLHLRPGLPYGMFSN
jgi:hypothetical protein